MNYFNVTGNSTLIKTLDSTDSTTYEFLSTSVPCLIRCLHSEHEDTCNDILPLQTELNNLQNTSTFAMSSSTVYEWIYVSTESSLITICTRHLNITLQKRSSDVIVTSTASLLDIDNRTTRYIYTFENISADLYKLSGDKKLSYCNYFLRKFDRYFHKSAGPSSQSGPGSTERMLTLSRDINTTFEISASPVYINSTIENVDIKLDGVDGLSKKQVYNETNAEHSNSSFHIPQSISSTTNRNTETKPMQQVKSTTKHHNALNDRFNMVVDIVQTQDGSRAVLPSNLDQENQNVPTYIVNGDISRNLNSDSGGKSLFAVILSLIGALLAVAIFILGFVLNDFLSRRKQIRKTRIRPFVSYY